MSRTLIALLMLPLLSLSAQAPDVSGEWAVTARFDAKSVARGMPVRADLVCTLNQQHDRLGGGCRPADGFAEVEIRGTVRGQHVEWRFDIALTPDGKDQTATYTSTLNRARDSMKGRFAVGGMRGEFTARKQ